MRSVFRKSHALSRRRPKQAQSPPALQTRPPRPPGRPPALSLSAATGLCPAWNNWPPRAVRGSLYPKRGVAFALGWEAPSWALTQEVPSAPGAGPRPARPRRLPGQGWEPRGLTAAGRSGPRPQRTQGHASQAGVGAPQPQGAPLLTGILGCGVNRDVCKGDSRNETDEGQQQPASDRLTGEECSRRGPSKDDFDRITHSF